MSLGRYKPQPGAVLNRANPISRDLAFLVYPGIDNPHDLVSGRIGSKLANGNFTKLTPYGHALESTSTNNGGGYWTYNAEFNRIVRRFTILLFANMPTGSNNGTFFNIPSDTGSGLRVLNFGLNSTQTACVAQYQRDASNNSTATSDNDMWSASDGWAQYAVTRQGNSGNVVKFYKNGQQFGATKSFGVNADFAPTAGQPACVLQRSSTSTGPAMIGACVMAGVWYRDLTADEIRSLYDDPFQLAAPRIFAIPLGQFLSGAAIDNAESVGAGTMLATAYLTSPGINSDGSVGSGVVAPQVRDLTSTGVNSDAVVGTGVVLASIELTGAAIDASASIGTGAVTASYDLTTQLNVDATIGAGVIAPMVRELTGADIQTDVIVGEGVITVGVLDLSSGGIQMDASLFPPTVTLELGRVDLAGGAIANDANIGEGYIIQLNTLQHLTGGGLDVSMSIGAGVIQTTIAGIGTLAARKVVKRQLRAKAAAVEESE